jgi:hypothetical protein
MSAPEDLCLEQRWLQFKRLNGEHMFAKLSSSKWIFPQTALAWSINLASRALSSLDTFNLHFICVVLMYISGSRNGWHFHLKESQLKGEESRGEEEIKLNLLEVGEIIDSGRPQKSANFSPRQKSIKRSLCQLATWSAYVIVVYFKGNNFSRSELFVAPWRVFAMSTDRRVPVRGWKSRFTIFHLLLTDVRD